MPDILEQGLKATVSGGIKTPKQTETIAGPGVNVSNKYGKQPQPKLSLTGRGKK